jgi:class III poly(R)-hydroxyalkanoic acid synthase PhaE subunit
MSDSNPFSPDAWLDAQRRYWDSWMDLARQAGGAAGAGRKGADQPWGEALEQWWRAVSPAAGEAGVARDFYDRLLDLGRSYFTMAEDLSKSASPAAGVDAWLEQMSAAFSGKAKAGGRAPRDFMAFFDLPLDTWQRTVSSFSPLPGDFLQGLQPDTSKDIHARLDRFLSVPAVGYSRESQQQYQHLGRLVLDYQKAMHEYTAAMSRLGMRSVERMRAKLDEAEQPVTSVRGLYNLWVDACEEEYAELTMSEEYAEIYGRMVNALMALKRQGAQMVDETLEGLNMPTRREVNTLHRRLQEMRRELRALRSALDEKTAAAPAAKPKAKRATAPKRTARARKTTTHGKKGGKNA